MGVVMLNCVWLAAAEWRTGARDPVVFWVQERCDASVGTAPQLGGDPGTALTLPTSGCIGIPSPESACMMLFSER